MTHTELVPCPFCGLTWLSHWIDKETRTMFVKCQDCGTCGPSVSTLPTIEPFDVSAKIIKAQELWNTRAVVDQVQG